MYFQLSSKKPYIHTYIYICIIKALFIFKLCCLIKKKTHTKHFMGTLNVQMRNSKFYRRHLAGFIAVLEYCKKIYMRKNK